MHSVLTISKSEMEKTPLMNKQGKLRSIGAIPETLGREGLRNIGFIIPEDRKLMAQQAVMLNRVEEELPSASDISKADNDFDLWELTKG